MLLLNHSIINTEAKCPLRGNHTDAVTLGLVLYTLSFSEFNSVIIISEKLCQAATCSGHLYTNQDSVINKSFCLYKWLHPNNVTPEAAPRPFPAYLFSLVLVVWWVTREFEWTNRSRDWPAWPMRAQYYRTSWSWRHLVTSQQCSGQRELSRIMQHQAVRPESSSAEKLTKEMNISVHSYR